MILEFPFSDSSIFRVFSVVVGCVCLGSCANNQIGRQTNVLSATASTAPPLMHGETLPPKKIDDKDYWDTDDFVPYKEDRHDTFDWKLFKVSLRCL